MSESVEAAAGGQGGERPQSPAAEGNGKTFEENMARLEVLVRQLERGELSLEDSLVCYQEGVALVNVCQGRLERAAKEIEVLTEGMHP